MPNEGVGDEYRSTCPYCDRPRLNTLTGESGEGNATAALRTHIVATAGDGHGPRHGVPADVHRVELSAHVVEVGSADTE